MARLARVGELTAVVLLALLVLVATSGWLYLIEPHTRGWGGSVADALPLDELARHAAMPLVVFVPTWAAAGGLLGLLARAARIERLTAGLAFTLLTGAWLAVASTVSLLVVRQVTVGEAFRGALHIPANYLAIALVGVVAALLGRRPETRAPAAPLIIAIFVAASGVIDLASALTPEIQSRLHWIEHVSPNAAPRLADALVAPAGLALLLLARGLRRRRRRAWQLTLAFVAAATVLHILKGLDYEEATANLLLAVALVARRHDFDGRGDPSERTRLLVRAPLFVIAVYAYGAFALWIDRASIDGPYSLRFALSATTRFLLGQDRGAADRLVGSFGQWFPISVFILGLAAAFSFLWSWLAPWRFRLSQQVREREQAARLVASFGLDTLAPFTLRADKSYFFSPDERAFLAYRVTAGVAVVSGDPIGPTDAIAPLLEQFLAFAEERDWRVAVLGASDRHLAVYRTLGLRALYHGDEAVVDPAAFTLEGRAVRKVRQSVHRLERQSYEAKVFYAGEIDGELRADLEKITALWKGGGPRRGFTMELDDLFRLEGRNAVFVIGFDARGEPQGFVHFAACHPSRTLSLSSMPRVATTPNGFNEWLVVSTLDWACTHDYQLVSLNFAPFAALFQIKESDLTRLQRLQRRTLQQLKGYFQLDNLLAFNRKFFPQWQKRYIIYQQPADLPRIALAGLAAEGYLPLANTRLRTLTQALGPLPAGAARRS